MQDILTGPKSAITQRKTLGSLIAKDMKETMNFLDNEMTPLVSNFQNTPEFFIGYQNNNRIGMPNVHHTRLAAVVVNEIGTPYFGALVTVDQYTDPNTKKTYNAAAAITNENGVCDVSEFFPGMRTVTISGTGIKTTSFAAMNFEKGKTIPFTFTVQPAFTNMPAPQQQPFSNKQTV